MQSSVVWDPDKFYACRLENTSIKFRLCLGFRKGGLLIDFIFSHLVAQSTLC